MRGLIGITAVFVGLWFVMQSGLLQPVSPALVAKLESGIEYLRAQVRDKDALIEAYRQAKGQLSPTSCPPSSPPCTPCQDSSGWAPASAPSTAVDRGRGRRKGIIGDLLLRLELDDMYAALRNVPPGICVDVGGHIGHTAAEMASYGHEVHVFEPFQGNLAQLRGAVASYGDKVTVYHGGVSHIGGTRAFGGAATKANDVLVTKGDAGYTAKAGTSAVGGIQGGKDGCAPLSATCIKSYVLDEIFPTQHLLMVKIDVQGGESAVLKGMRKMIEERRITWDGHLFYCPRWWTS